MLLPVTTTSTLWLHPNYPLYKLILGSTPPAPHSNPSWQTLSPSSPSMPQNLLSTKSKASHRWRVQQNQRGWRREPIAEDAEGWLLQVLARGGVTCIGVGLDQPTGMYTNWGVSSSMFGVKMAEPLIRQEISKDPFFWKKFIFSLKKSSTKHRDIKKKFKQT